MAHVEEYRFACSQDAQEQMAKVIQEKGLNRVVVAACTPRTHEPLFQQTLESAGLNKYLFEMANIRNQCSWVHSDEPEIAAATAKAKDLVAMAVAKANLLEPLDESDMPVSQAGPGGGRGRGRTDRLAQPGPSRASRCIWWSAPAAGWAGEPCRLGQTGSGEDVRENLDALIRPGAPATS